MTEQSRFTQYSAGVVYEPARDLYWTANDVTADRVNHASALAAVEKLNADQFDGFADWRLPEVEEMLLLVDRSKYNPAIDTEFFPACKSDWYWSATDDASEDKDSDTGHSDSAWFVNFYDGLSGICYRDYHLRVRAVRGPARQ